MTEIDQPETAFRTNGTWLEKALIVAAMLMIVLGGLIAYLPGM